MIWLHSRIYDDREKEIPPIGMLKLKDAETGNYVWVDSNSRKTRNAYKQWWDEHENRLNAMFTKCGVDNVEVNTNEDYVKALMTLFKKRGLK